jgi:hypothetical protein
MKNTIKILFLLFSLNVNGQTKFCEEEASKGFYFQVKSFEKDSIDGNLSIEVKLHATDTIYLGSHLILECKSKLLNGFITSNNLLDSLVYGDSITFTLNLQYNIDSIPFYPMSLNLELKDSIGEDSINSKYYTECKIYFTPWNTVEVWNIYDFHNIKRLWLTGNDNPERVYIDKNSLPNTDIIADTLSDTLGNFYIRQIPGLAFAIPYNSPDTFNYEFNETNPYGVAGNYSGSKRSDGCGVGRKKFTGRIQNFRIYTTYAPIGNPSNPVKVWLKNAKIEFRVNRWPDPIIGSVWGILHPKRIL